MCGIASQTDEFFPTHVAERGPNAVANLRQLGAYSMMKRGFQLLAKTRQLSSIVPIATAQQGKPLVAPLQHFDQQRFGALEMIVEMAQQGFHRRCDAGPGMRQQPQRPPGSLLVERIAIFADFRAG